MDRGTFAFLVFSFASASATAQVYKWTDEQGHVRYGENPPTEAKASQIQAPPGGATGQARSGGQTLSIPITSLPKLSPEEQERRRRIYEQMDRKQREKERTALRDSPDGQQYCAMMRTRISDAESGAIRGQSSERRLTAEEQRQILPALRAEYEKACR